MITFFNNLSKKQTVESQQQIMSRQLQAALDRQLKAAQHIVDTVRNTLETNDRIKIATKADI